MAVDGARFLVQLRKLAIRSIRTSIRSVRNHPFLVCTLLFAIFLYRSSPFLFSLLVSASPVLVCTAVLLGTLLSFGHPQIPEVDEDEKLGCEVSSLKTSSVSNPTSVFQKEADKGVDDSAFMGDVCSVSRFEGSHLTPQNSQEIVFEQQSVEGANVECKSREVEFIKENDHFEPENHEEMPTFDGTTARVSEVQEKAFENGGSKEGSDDDHVDDRAESSSVPWARVNGDHGDDEDEDDDEDDDSGSDGAESSSPDPSMADIIPLLDELHPLIECESLIPDNSGLPRNGSHSSHASSISSDEETDHNESEEEEAGNDDGEENRGGKEDEEKSAITWTADDQKNLMDLGTSELERNQRLESLIARRRSRKNMRMMTERNLIDLDELDLSFQVAPISTTRQNPFDFPNDTYDNSMDLPPIPGSAPSRMVQRRNPFDIPYDSGEEKPDLMGDSFQQEFMPPHQKEPVFRRHESFHIGSSFFEFTRQEPRDTNRASRFKPYFIPERLASEGGSSFSSFRRQSSEISESSSSFHRQTSGISEVSSFHRQSSDISESKASSSAESGPVSAEVGQEEMKVGDHDFTEEKTPDPEIDHASQHVEHGSQSSENLDDQIQKRDFDPQMPEIRLGTEFEQSEHGQGAEINLGSTGNDHDLDSWVSEARDLVASAGIIEGDVVEDKHYSSSSSSISSEGHNDVKEADEGVIKEEEIGSHLMEKPEVQTVNLFMESDFHNHPSMHSHSAERNPLETIEEEHIISPSSSLGSEERTVTDGLKLNDDMMNTHHIRPDAVNSEFPTEQALNPSDSGFSIDLEETHPADPVYDLSPQASKISLSISSEELAELEQKDLIQERDGLLHKTDGDVDARVDQEDPILSVIEQRHDDGKAEHSKLLLGAANELNEEAPLVEETNLFPANAVDASDSFEEQLISAAEGGGPLINHSLINPLLGDYAEEAFIAPEKHEEVSSENSLMHNEVYTEMNDLLSPHSQSVGTSSVVQELVQEPVTDFIDFSEPVGGGGEFESSILGESPFTDSFVPETDDIKELDEALLSELDAVGDFHVTERGMALTQETLQAENVEVGINEFHDFHASDREIQFQPLGDENDESNEKSASDAFFINEGQPEDQSAEVFMGESQDSPLLESEPTENVKQLNEEDAEQSASEALIVNTLELKVEPEFSQNDENAELSGIKESSNLQDEHLVEGTEAVSLEGFESSFRTDKAINFHDNNRKLEKDEPVAETHEFVPAMEEEIERSAIDASSDLGVLKNDSLIEKDEQPAVETKDSVPSMEEEFERFAIDASSESDASMKEAHIEKDEQPGAETTESVILMEEEIERSANYASSDSDAPKNEDQIEKDEESAADTTASASFREEETETSAIDALIEKNEEPAAETTVVVPAIEEGIETPAVDASSDSHFQKSEAQIDKDEQSATEKIESVISMKEEIERSAVDTCFSSQNEEDQPTAETSEPVSSMEEEMETPATGASEDEAQIEKQAVVERDLSVPAMEEEIETSAVDASSDPHFRKNEAQIDKDEQSAAETIESVISMEEEIKRSAVDACFSSQIEEEDQPTAETVEPDSSIEEEIERPVTGALENEAQIEKQPAVETNLLVPDMEEEIERSAIVDSSDSHISKNEAFIEKDVQPASGTNESAPTMEDDIERSTIVASSDSLLVKNDDLIVEDEQSPVETNESAPSTEEEIERAAFVDSSDSHVIKNEALVEKDVQPASETNESAPTMEDDIERSRILASSDSLLIKNDSPIVKDEQSAVETYEFAPSTEEEIERSLFDASSDSDHPKNESQIETDKQSAEDANESASVMEEETLNEKDVAVVRDESKDVQEMENQEAESLYDVTIRQFKPDQPTSAQVSSSLQIEPAESQSLQEEDHEMEKTQLAVGHLKRLTESVSVAEESDCQGSSNTAPELPKREEE